MVVKGPPWIPKQDKFDPYWSFAEEDMQLLQSWGLNAIRLVKSYVWLTVWCFSTLNMPPKIDC